jgi:DNA repair protein RecO (recombination protein O)
VSPPRALPQQTTAIVIGLTAYREADLIVRLLTPDLGRISALARSARRSSRRFGGAIDVGNRIDANLRAPRSGLWGFDSADLVDGRSRTRSDLGRLGLLVYATEVVGRLAREEHPEPKLFGLLDMACTLLNGVDTVPESGFRVGLEAKALTFAGLAPVLDRCAHCGQAPSDPMCLLHHTAVANHARCTPNSGGPVSVAWLQAAEACRREPLRENLHTDLPPGPVWALAEAVEAHLGKALKSKKVLPSLLAPPSK